MPGLNCICILLIPFTFLLVQIVLLYLLQLCTTLMCGFLTTSHILRFQLARQANTLEIYRYIAVITSPLMTKLIIVHLILH